MLPATLSAAIGSLCVRRLAHVDKQNIVATIKSSNAMSPTMATGAFKETGIGRYRLLSTIIVNIIMGISYALFYRIIRYCRPLLRIYQLSAYDSPFS